MGREFSVDEGFDGNSYGELDKSAVSRQEAGLFNTQEAQVAALIVRMLGCDAAKVQRDATLESLGGDSLDGIEIVMEAEEEFGIEISDDEMERAKTVQDVFDVVKAATDHEADATIRPVSK